MNTRLAKTALKNISRNKRRSLLSGIAIGVAAMSIVMLFSIFAGMTQDMEKNLQNLFTGEVRIRHQRYDEYERYNPLHLMVDWEAAQEVLSGLSGVESFVPRTVFPGSIYMEGSNFGAIGVGADFTREKDFQPIEEIVKAGRLPEPGSNEVLVGALLARDLKLTLGDKMTVMTTTAARGSNAMTFEIVGLAAFPVGSLNSKYFWAPLDRVQHLLRMPGGVQDVLIKSTEDYSGRQLALDVQALADQGRLGEEAGVRFWKNISNTYGLMEMAQNIYYFIAAFFFLLGSTVIINTTIMVIYERMREIGTLQALGMHGGELTRLFFLEGTFISAMGAFIGVLIGIVIVLVLGQVGIDFTDAMSGMDFEVSSILYPRLNGFTVILVYVYSVAVASLATLIPSRRAARIQPVEALRCI